MNKVIDKSEYNIPRGKRTVKPDEGLNKFEREALQDTLRRHKVSFRELAKH
ncbi:hypothetical protein [Methanoplanus limicola]|uniref:Uncharacterized protein n=1 Tax=Methanoplanus limicola DSM 2279 TaxID=937775 RepID=H1Z0F4_9EURY|nr:hypothetical protein [Methanoplanus limicola]EHQ34421.1 hypothetical protein Metlim_0276 [Methanoplanus limicola DSM 2279]